MFFPMIIFRFFSFCPHGKMFFRGSDISEERLETFDAGKLYPLNHV